MFLERCEDFDRTSLESRSAREVGGLNPLSFDPATNNEPLQFNSTNGPLVSECTLENGAENSKKRKRPSLP
ncbi:hypothetical protein Z043_106820, partial [Scleropages formosus]